MPKAPERFSISAFLGQREHDPWPDTLNDIQLLLALTTPLTDAGACLSGAEAAEIGRALTAGAERDLAVLESFRPKVEVWAQLNYRDPILSARGTVSARLDEREVANAIVIDHQDEEGAAAVTICPLCSARAKTRSERMQRFPIQQHVRVSGLVIGYAYACGCDVHVEDDICFWSFRDPPVEPWLAPQRDDWGRSKPRPWPSPWIPPTCTASCDGRHGGASPWCGRRQSQ